MSLEQATVEEWRSLFGNRSLPIGLKRHFPTDIGVTWFVAMRKEEPYDPKILDDDRKIKTYITKTSAGEVRAIYDSHLISPIVEVDLDPTPSGLILQYLSFNWYVGNKVHIGEAIFATNPDPEGPRLKRLKWLTGHLNGYVQNMHRQVGFPIMINKTTRDYFRSSMRALKGLPEDLQPRFKEHYRRFDI